MDLEVHLTIDHEHSVGRGTASPRSNFTYGMIKRATAICGGF